MKFKKYTPNVWLVESDIELYKFDIVTVQTKYSEVEVEIFNLISFSDGKYLYSNQRTDIESYADKKARKYSGYADNANKRSDKHFEQAQEGKDFLVLAEPIKIGHHSEKRHRALIDRNYARMGKSVEEDRKAKEYQQKADYWEAKAKEINLSHPESIGYFGHLVERLSIKQAGLKNGTIKRAHSYSLSYCTKRLKDAKSKLIKAKILWGNNHGKV